jgi:hypothetical protein
VATFRAKRLAYNSPRGGHTRSCLHVPKSLTYHYSFIPNDFDGFSYNQKKPHENF